MINIAELLKDAPKDLKLYSPICGHCKLSCILYDDDIRVIAHDVPFRFDKYGRFCSADDAECLLFPSKDCRTWEGWKLPVEPKFKVGDKIEATIYGIKRRVTIREVDKTYRCYFGTLEECIGFSEQYQWHLAPKPHYDIKNFKPFDKVLVRDNDRGKWRPSIFSYHIKGRQTCYPFCCIGNSFSQCIPFEGNEHLLGTTDMTSNTLTGKGIEL